MSVEKVSEDRLSLYNLPGDIYDLMAAFMANPDLFRFLTLSRHITISSYLLRDRQRALWTKCGAKHLAIKGDLAGLQYLHSLGSVAWTTTYAMDCAAENGHLAVVEFLHGIGATCTANAMDDAAKNGHLAVVEFLHRIGAPYTAKPQDFIKKFDMSMITDIKTVVLIRARNTGKSYLVKDLLFHHKHIPVGTCMHSPTEEAAAAAADSS